ncbi:putative monogalactosyldiacylglycerol synthase 2, chloroplastic isoform X2 [Carex rostrata]
MQRAVTITTLDDVGSTPAGGVARGSRRRLVAPTRNWRRRLPLEGRAGRMFWCSSAILVGATGLRLRRSEMLSGLSLGMNIGDVVAGIMKYKPDMIISVHPLMQHIPLWIMKWESLQQQVPFVTVITDLNTCHPTWFHQSVTRCYCPSREVAKKALIEGLKPSQIRVFGLPIRPSFCRAVLNKDELRNELGMDPLLPAVLLMGGGEGMGPVEDTAMALGEALYDKRCRKAIGQIVVICGRNQTLRSTLQSASAEWKVPAKIRGFETQIERWMGACDCIVTKAGPGTIAEALIRGLPIILNDFLPGQEVGNVPYVVENGAGVFSKDPNEAARIVARWFGLERGLLKKYSQNALRLAQPNAVFDIVKDINKIVQQRVHVTRFSHTLTKSLTFDL